MGNTNFQTIFQMQSIVNSVVKQATGREAVQNIDMDYVTVAQQKKTGENTTDYAGMASFVNNNELPLKVLAKITAVQSGEGDPAPDNVRPITGWTGVNVRRIGKNLANISDTIHATNVTKTITGNSITLTTTTASTNRAGEILIPSTGLVGKTLTLSGSKVITSTDSAKAMIRARTGSTSTNLVQSATGNISFAISAVIPECDYVVVYLGINGSNASIGDSATYTNVQLEIGSYATAYEPYNGDIYTITFPEATGTVYGGVLNVTTGVLTINKAIKKISDLRWTFVTNYAYFNTTELISVIVKPADASTMLEGLLCSSYKTATAQQTGSGLVNLTIAVDPNGALRIRDDSYTDPDEWKTALGDQTIIYPLATPVTVQLTPTEIDSLIGENNLYADTGDVSVSYTTYYPII